ncbi:MAG TPA: hypothetical protein PKC28_00440 [Bdellovibrionales bacterium]|nr:hypothetical protein [Bdellovibrionales bacterium]
MRLIMILALSMLVACASDKEDFGAKPRAAKRINEFTPEERRRLAPTEIFVAVLNNDVEETKRLSEATPGLLETTNGDGDRPLGLALKLGSFDVAEFLISRLTVFSIKHQNAKGESYLFIASRVGAVKYINLIGDIEYNTQGVHFDLDEIDLLNNEGQNALFVAADRQTVEALKAQNRRQYALHWDFAFQEDKHGQTFIHTAARDGREDVLLWASQEFCDPTSWESSDSWMSYPTVPLKYAARWFQSFLPDWYVPWALMVNEQTSEVDDHGDGVSQIFNQTALHLAVENRQWKSVRALAGCRWLDYDLLNSQNENQLQTLLKNLNPLAATADEDARAAFHLLLESRTPFATWSTLTARVNNRNAAGESALHVAARLNDPYFYNRLKEFGDIYQTNNEGVTPDQLFQRQRAIVGN